jgi:hypothetical protein
LQLDGPTKKCIVSRPDGKDITRAGVYYIVKVDEPEEEDPFKEEEGDDPFKVTDPAEERDACFAREADVKAKLAAATKPKPTCGARGIGEGRRIDVTKLAGLNACKNRCLANPKCQAYCGSDDSAGWCYLFSDPQTKYSTGYQHVITKDRDC